MARTEHELRVFDRFRKQFDDFPDGEVDSECESPDFIVNCGDHRIGIEHTDLYWPSDGKNSPFQEGESMRKRVVDQFRERLESSPVPPVWVALFLNDRLKVSKKRVVSLAGELLDLVQKNIPAMNSVFRVDAAVDWGVLPDEVHELEVRRLKGLDFKEVTAPEAGLVPKLQKSDIERAILRKESRLPAYRENANEQWLLVSVDSGSMATWYTDRKPEVYRGFSTGFDRVFVLWVVSGRVIELDLS